MSDRQATSFLKQSGKHTQIICPYFSTWFTVVTQYTKVFRANNCFSLGFCISFSRWRAWWLIPKPDGDPPVLQPLPIVVQKYKYLQVGDKPVYIIPNLSSPLNIPLNNTTPYSALLLTYYFLFWNFCPCWLQLFRPVSHSLSLLENYYSIWLTVDRTK